MEATEWQAEQFEQNRGHLRAVAQRMLGSAGEADDAVQEAWLRLSRSDTAQVENMRGWLTTVVSRICLDMLRARQSRREDLVDEWSRDPGRRAVRRGRGRSRARGADRRRRRAGAAGRARDAVAGRATLVRAARHVRRPVRGDRPDHRAQRRGGSPTRQPGAAAGQGRAASRDAPSLAQQRKVVDAFLAASRNGDFDALLEVLDPDVVFRAEAGTTGPPVPRRLIGAERVANAGSRARDAVRASRPAGDRQRQSRARTWRSPIA